MKTVFVLANSVEPDEMPKHKDIVSIYNNIRDNLKVFQIFRRMNYHIRASLLPLPPKQTPKFSSFIDFYVIE